MAVNDRKSKRNLRWVFDWSKVVVNDRNLE